MAITPNPTDRHIGSRVRMRRKMPAMSQTQLADALGITYQQVRKNESGTNRISEGQSWVAGFVQWLDTLSAPMGSGAHRV